MGRGHQDHHRSHPLIAAAQAGAWSAGRVDRPLVAYSQAGLEKAKPLQPFCRFIAGVVVALTFSFASPAADYPSRPVSIVVAFTPGGPSDVLSRIIGLRLNEILHQPFIIENRPGSGGNIAAEQVARATPDGYTLLMGNNSILATNAALYKKLGYDAERDFTPITMVGTQANILVVNPAVPAQSMAELIALAKANPGQLNFASSGHGAAAHLAGELFKAEAKVNIVHVPYKGAAPALQDVMAGHVQMMFATAASVIGLIKSGKVRALAVTTPDRTALAAGPADGRRARHQGLRRHHLARPGGADRHAAGGHRNAALRRDGGAKGSGDPQAADRPGRRHRGLHAEGVRGLHQVRNSEMDRGGQDLRRADRVGLIE